MSNLKNFAKATLAATYGATDTSFVVAAGQGTRFPATPFNATVFNGTDYADPADDPFVEIVTVTTVSVDTLIVTRGAESTIATAKNLSGKTYFIQHSVTKAVVDGKLDFPPDGSLWRPQGVAFQIYDTVKSCYRSLWLENGVLSVGPEDNTTSLTGGSWGTGWIPNNGTRWYSGTTEPDNSLYQVGDFYLQTLDGPNNAAGSVYEKTGSAAWTLRANIKGADGSGGGSVAGKLDKAGDTMTGLFGEYSPAGGGIYRTLANPQNSSFPFNDSVQVSQNSNNLSTYNVVWHHGYNLDQNRARINNADGGYGVAMETNYAIDASNMVFEYQLYFIDTAGTLYRPLEFVMYKSGPQNGTVQGQFAGTSFDFQNNAKTNQMVKFSINSGTNAGGSVLVQNNAVIVGTNNNYAFLQQNDGTGNFRAIASMGGIHLYLGDANLLGSGGLIIPNVPIYQALFKGGDVQQNWAFSGDISPTQIAATTNDYNPSGLSTATVLRLTTDASRDLTGITGGADGRILKLLNVGSFNLVLKDANASSTAANRFALNGDVTLAPNESASLIYDSTSSRWRLHGVYKNAPTFPSVPSPGVPNAQKSSAIGFTSAGGNLGYNQHIPVPTTRRVAFAQACGSNTAPSNFGELFQENGTASLIASTSTSPAYRNYATTATINTTAGYNLSATGSWMTGRNIHFRAKFRLNESTLLRAVVGVTSASLASVTGADAASGYTVALMCNPALTNFKWVARDNTTTTTTDTGVAFDTNEHTVELWEDTANSRWFASLDGAAPVTLTANVPPANNAVGPMIGIQTLEAAIKNIKFAGLMSDLDF